MDVGHCLAAGGLLAKWLVGDNVDNDVQLEENIS